MKHIFIIDPIEKLNIKKDSSLFWALTLKKMGHEVYLMGINDLYATNLDQTPALHVSEFEGKIAANLYVDYVSLIEKTPVTLHPKDVLHMRLDPPFDEHYLHALWLLNFWENSGVKVTNSPKGIFLNQEKITAYQQGRSSIPSYVGALGASAKTFLAEIKKQGFKEFIVKPLNSFSGIGVYKFSLDEDIENITALKNKLHDTFVLQPFMEQIYQGEQRSIYWQGKEIGTILKKPKDGSYLANVAQGGSFQLCSIDPKVKSICDGIAAKLLKDGVELIAYDIIDGRVNEVNITCPGLLVEVSNALGKNIVAENMI